MTNTLKRVMAGSFLIAALVVASPAVYADTTTDNDFTSSSAVVEMPYADYAAELPTDAKYQLRQYMNYKLDREPCPNFLEIPEGFTREGCDLKPEEMAQKPLMIKHVNYVVEKEEKEPVKLYRVIEDHEVTFDFNSSDLTDDALTELSAVTEIIKKQNPAEVTVSGFADTAGPESYNLTLSKERAINVSNALHEMGVKNRILEEDAYGETELAVETNDGVPLEENRRVLIELTPDS